MKVKIITDSAADISQEEAKQLGIEVLPIKINFDDEEYLDGINLSHKQFYEKLIETSTFPRTSQINPYEFEECFKKNADYDVVLITLSKEMTGGYLNATLVAKDFPNVRVIDSENVSIGQNILVKYAVRLANQGKTAKEIETEINKVKKDVCVVALLDTLTYLKKGGRISSAQAVIGGMLNIKPVVVIKEGKVVIMGKALGSRIGNNMLRKQMKESGGVNFDMPFVAGYSGLTDSMLIKYLQDSKDLYSVDMKDIPIVSIGATIGTHAGPGVTGVAYFKRHE